eukprot:CAMPEP_0113713732 /NCGR_PEP_ID=MMETSP0038_2-20120614/32180_1 /TAXON_ID=2898 /ORGANISM="Cryptomonas paramecium" /LENGTH=402 /DNA_ID=CAMNT_0000640541 /DNA_START=128 /DNA_END=1337 /DNA_ORIENTATION=- /assembly_acc=CAM_ASM_000170
MIQEKDFYAKLGFKFVVKKICVRDASKKRDFELPQGCAVVTDPKEILDDDSLEVIVELMGGTTLAWEIVQACLLKGKKVVTANKALLSKYLPRVIEILRDTPKARLCFEAAVCGGIPIIHTLQHDYLGDSISELRGIMNGTTNYILSKMESDNADYAAVLKEAQDLGFAEADPAADVEGWDARSKLALLIKLAFGTYVPEESIPCKGISRITSEDFAYAKQLGGTVKILGVCRANEDGSLSPFVSPCIVSFSDVVSRLSGCTNMVEVTSANMGNCHFSGPGAGRFPTANSVINDLVMLARGEPDTPFPLEVERRIVSEIQGLFYVRFIIKDGVGIVRVIGELAEKNGISIYSILQTPVKDVQRVPFVMTTEPTTLTQVKEMCAQMRTQPFVVDDPVIMPLLI